ncbi:MAG: OadG family protein [Veillonella sp.]|uniref:methylmalonyl-CoA decarboxylase subunit delta n=1 Tax=Veillonella sp. TaxID=1926307 RepID=UPI00290409F2|nr:OadG family protein [Veillonella sp.]MDU1974438.1 OadG family protein [Veillonella sp.]MDU3434720.1 OadG family protein [Veillonella sp.]
MEGQAVTTNPLLIMAINMTVVFVVLILLGVLMTIVHLIDPTKKKKEAPAATAPVTAPAAAPAAPSASAQNEDEVVAAIVGAIVAMGYSSEQIASIRPTATSAKWRLEGRLSGRG